MEVAKKERWTCDDLAREVVNYVDPVDTQALRLTNKAWKRIVDSHSVWTSWSKSLFGRSFSPVPKSPRLDFWFLFKYTGFKSPYLASEKGAIVPFVRRFGSDDFGPKTPSLELALLDFSGTNRINGIKEELLESLEQVNEQLTLEIADGLKLSFQYKPTVLYSFALNLYKEHALKLLPLPLKDFEMTKRKLLFKVICLITTPEQKAALVQEALKIIKDEVPIPTGNIIEGEEEIFYDTVVNHSRARKLYLIAEALNDQRLAKKLRKILANPDMTTTVHGFNLFHARCLGGNAISITDLFMHSEQPIDVKTALKGEPNDKQGTLGRNPLHYAVISGDLQTVRYYCDCIKILMQVYLTSYRFGPSPSDLKVTTLYEKPLHTFSHLKLGELSDPKKAERIHQSVYQSLDEAGRSPFDLACMLGHVEIAMELLKREPSYRKLTIKQFLLIAQGGNLELFKEAYRLSGNERKAIVDARDKLKNNLLHIVANSPGDHVELFQEIATIAPELLVQTGSLGRTSLHKAARRNNERITLFLVKKRPQDLNAQDLQKNTPIHSAASMKAHKTLKILTAADEEPFKEELSKAHEELQMPHVIAARSKDWKSLMIFLDHGLDPKAAFPYSVATASPLVHFAATLGDTPLLHALKEDRELEDEQGERAIHYACRAKQLGAVKYLSTHKCSLNRGRSFAPPLHIALLNEDKKTSKLLVEQGAGVQERDQERNSAVDIYVDALKDEIVENIDLLDFISPVDALNTLIGHRLTALATRAVYSEGRVEIYSQTLLKVYLRSDMTDQEFNLFSNCFNRRFSPKNLAFSFLDQRTFPVELLSSLPSIPAIGHSPIECLLKGYRENKIKKSSVRYYARLLGVDIESRLNRRAYNTRPKRRRR